jgi:hypothetical protein
VEKHPSLIKENNPSCRNRFFNTDFGQHLVVSKF